MKRLRISLSFAVGLALSIGTLAAAQDKPPVSGTTGQPPVGESRLEVGLSFAQTLGTSTFTASQTVRENQEDGTLKSSYSVGKAPGAALDLQYNLNQKFGVRLGAQTFSRESEGSFEASIPHPFFFSRPRSVSGTATGMGFKESALSLTGVYRGGSGKWGFNLEGGPAYFSIDATIAEKVAYGEVYPYDTLTFNGVTSSKKKTSAFGFAVGLGISRALSNAVSVVAQGRFTQGASDLDVNGQKVNIKAGGAQALIGLRFVLARKRVGS